MDSDVIKQIWLDTTGSICVKPNSKRFDYIYRSAMGIYWNSSEGFLYPRIVGSWSPTDWFRQILAADRNEYHCELYITLETEWINIDKGTRKAIECEYEKGRDRLSAFLVWFNNHKDKYINIEIAGEIFGGRYGESPQSVRDYEVSEQNITIYFESSERLIITNPSSLMIGSRNELCIDKAEKVFFGWYFYGRSRIMENWCTETYDLKEDGQVIFNLSGPINSYLASYRTFFLGDHHFVRLI
jgi:hypothetical protein